MKVLLVEDDKNIRTLLAQALTADGYALTEASSAEEAMAAAARLRRDDPNSVTAGLLRLHADRVRMVERESRLRERFEAAHPQVPSVTVPALAGDVHDLHGLRQVGSLLAGERPT